LIFAWIFRAGDFIVNEIDLDGNVVRLTNFDIPVVEVPEVIADLEDSNQKRIKAVRDYNYSRISIRANI